MKNRNKEKTRKVLRYKVKHNSHPEIKNVDLGSEKASVDDCPSSHNSQTS
jgi:hypothetical protein